MSTLARQFGCRYGMEGQGVPVLRAEQTHRLAYRFISVSESPAFLASSPPGCATACGAAASSSLEDEMLVAMLIEDNLLNAGASILGPKTTLRDALQAVQEGEADMVDAVVLDL